MLTSESNEALTCSGSANARMQALLDSYTSTGKEWGLQLAIYRDGKLIVNASSGIMEGPDGKPVDEHTLFPVFSTTKGIVATIMHLLVERGKISYDTPIAEVWPEFAQNGKDKITLRHALNHTSGLAMISEECSDYDKLCNWNFMVGLLERQKPASEPGTVREYHPITYGWIMGEIARRVDGRTIWQLIDEEIRRPLNIHDMYVGVPAEVEPRIAILKEEAPEPIPVTTTPQITPNWMRPISKLMNRSDVRRASIPGANGMMSAAAVARHYAALLPGGVDGVELLPPSRIEQATQLAPDQVPADDIIALGYRSAITLAGRNLYTFGHAGYGGSFGWACPEKRWAVGFTKNLFTKVWHVGDIIQAMVDTLEEES